MLTLLKISFKIDAFNVAKLMMSLVNINPHKQYKFKFPKLQNC